MLVPGFHESRDSRNYPALVRMIEECGYRVIFYTPSWDKGIDEWVQGIQAVCIAHQLIAEETIPAGFSYGAFVCLAFAAAWQPKKLWLWSLASPYGDDRPDVIAYYARQVVSQTKLIIGEEEFRRDPKVSTRVLDAFRGIGDSRLALASGAGHDPLDPNYMRVIRDTL